MRHIDHVVVAVRDLDGVAALFTHGRIAGMEDGLFPLARAFDEPDALEEERRLFYVAVTRAMQELFFDGQKVWSGISMSAADGVTQEELQEDLEEIDSDAPPVPPTSTEERPRD